MADPLKDASRAVMARIETLVQQAVEESAADLVEKLRDRLTEPKHGREYGRHRASAPGEPPATQTGNLMDAVRWVPVSTRGGRGRGASVFVGREASYAARFLEFGSPGGKIAPRPWFYPTAEEHRADFTEAVARALRRLT